MEVNRSHAMTVVLLDASVLVNACASADSIFQAETSVEGKCRNQGSVHHTARAPRMAQNATPSSNCIPALLCPASKSGAGSYLLPWPLQEIPRKKLNPVQPFGWSSSPHSLHRKIWSSGRLLLSIPLVRLWAAHKPKPHRARFCALRLRFAPKIESASLRLIPRHL